MNIEDKQNDEDKIKFAFIAYLISALERNRIRFIKKLEKISTHETSLSDYEENGDVNFIKLMVDFENHLPVEDQIENPKLFSSLKSLRANENIILLFKATTDYTFKEIALLLDINENTAKTLYYSAVSKMRQQLSEDDSND